MTIIIIMSLPIGQGTISVCPSVCPARTQWIIREPKDLACPNLEGRFPTFDATCTPVSRSKGQRSRSPGPLMLTHIVRRIFRMARPTNFKLGTQMEDDDPHQPQVPWPPRSKVKVARSRDQSEPSWPNAVPVSLEPAGGIHVGRTRRPHFMLLHKRLAVGLVVMCCLGQRNCASPDPVSTTIGNHLSLTTDRQNHLSTEPATQIYSSWSSLHG